MTARKPAVRRVPADSPALRNPHLPRYMVIKVEGRHPPTIDISDFTIHEAHAVVGWIASHLEQRCSQDQPTVTADGVTFAELLINQPEPEAGAE